MATTSVATTIEPFSPFVSRTSRHGFFQQFYQQCSSNNRGADSTPLQIVLAPRPTLEVDHVDGYPVVPRDETVAYMREHDAQFQSALSMLDSMYDDLDLDVSYRESEHFD